LFDSMGLGRGVLGDHFEDFLITIRPELDRQRN